MTRLGFVEQLSPPRDVAHDIRVALLAVCRTRDRPWCRTRVGHGRDGDLRRVMLQAVIPHIATGACIEARSVTWTTSLKWPPFRSATWIAPRTSTSPWG